MNRLKYKWGIKSNFQLLIIFLVFSVTGSLTLWIAKPLLSLLRIEKELWFFWLARILIIFPVYQILIVIIGALFGQFRFFWDFEKKILRRLGFKHFQDTE